MSSTFLWVDQDILIRMMVIPRTPNYRKKVQTIIRVSWSSSQPSRAGPGSRPCWPRGLGGACRSWWWSSPGHQTQSNDTQILSPHLLQLHLRLQEGVEERGQTLHLLRVVVAVDGVQFEPDEGLVSVVGAALGHDLVGLEDPVELADRFVEERSQVVDQPVIDDDHDGDDIEDDLLGHGVRRDGGGFEVGEESDERHVETGAAVDWLELLPSVSSLVRTGSVAAAVQAVGD